VSVREPSLIFCVTHSTGWPTTIESLNSFEMFFSGKKAFTPETPVEMM
jgi:hypothetical protein